VRLVLTYQRITALLLIALVGVVTLALQAWKVIDILANLTDIWLWVGASLLGIAFGLLTRGIKITERGAIREKPSAKIEVTDKTISNQDVLLDGHIYRRMKFVNCRMIFEDGNFELHDNDFENCKWVAKGNAVTILKVAKMIGGTELRLIEN